MAGSCAEGKHSFQPGLTKHSVRAAISTSMEVTRLSRSTLLGIERLLTSSAPFLNEYWKLAYSDWQPLASLRSALHSTGCHSPERRGSIQLDRMKWHL